MELKSVQRLRWMLSLHYAILAWLTAMLVATGTGTIFLPVFIFFVSVAALIFVDGLEWFALGRIGSYIGMSLATVVSVASYLYAAFTLQSESMQLLAIAGLLVYPEAVLFLQRKSLRVFEQLAIFLLLEMIVAALVNDNLLFGALLTPIMLFWVSSLFLFSRYATLVAVNPQLDTPIPKLAEVLFRRFMKRVVGKQVRVPVATTKFVQSNEAQAIRGVRRLMQSVPIGIGAIAFAGFFFYLLPRTSPSTMEAPLGVQRRVGLPRSLTVGSVGRLLQDPTPVMRVTLTHLRSGATYPLREPPYLRARVMDVYGPANRGRWRSYGEWVFGGISDPRRLQGIQSVDSLLQSNRDAVNVEFDIKRQFVRTMYCIPPVFAVSQQKVNVAFDRFNMVIAEVDPSDVPGGKSLQYEIGSAGFADGVQVPVIPAVWRVAGFAGTRNRFNLTRNFRGFALADEYRQDLLLKAELTENQPLAFSRYLERHFHHGGFTYTLDLAPPIDPDIDPIEDFLVNQRKGHCQYFASAMLVLMRQSGIPSRIVVGFHPTEFNRLGEYFPVKQSDAHAWVEGLFTKDEIVGSEYERWLTDAENYWIRFDPTPGGDGEVRSIVDQDGQAMDYADKLWKDYVVEGQKLTGENSLYKPVAEGGQNAYDDVVESLKNLKDNLERGRLLPGRGGIGFAWPITIAIISLGTFAILVWRLIVILPRVAPRLARRLGISQPTDRIQQEFFARCLRLLAARGMVRKSWETPGEFTDQAAISLVDDRFSIPSDARANKRIQEALKFLTSIYYRLRFGSGGGPTPEERSAIAAALHEVEAATRAGKRLAERPPRS